jgi:ABC-type nitrate/sulfonate/bicarbonate transport system substrate-binding protein
MFDLKRSFRVAISAIFSFVLILISSSVTIAQQKDPILVFNQPIPIGDAMWMAMKNKYFDRENLDFKLKWWSSGTLAMQTFINGRDGKPGFGDFNFGGELPAVNFWQNTDGDYAIIAVIERDGNAYNLVTRADIKTPQDLKGKVIATRKGSSAEYGLSRFMEQSGLKEADLTIKDLEPNVVPSAMDRGDIDGFFMWEPYSSESLKISGSKVHILANGSKYFTAYYVLGAWKPWLKSHPGVAARFLKALDDGKTYAETHKSDVVNFAKEEFSLEDASAIAAQYDYNGRVIGLDKQTYDFFNDLAAWMKTKGIMKREFDPKSFFEPGPLQEAFKDRVSAEYVR